jgi:hypothetical protein
MDKIKIKDKKTGAIKEVNKALADDFIGTGEFELVEEKKASEKTFVSPKSEEK